MIRKLTGLFKKLIDKSEEIIEREDEILDIFVPQTETLTSTVTDPVLLEFEAPFKYDSGVRYDECFYD